MQTLKKRTISFLKWTEKYTKTDMLYLAKGSFWLSLATAANWAILLVLLYAFGNYVEPEVYGMYRYFLSVYGMLTVFTLAGFNGALVRSVAQGNEGELFRIFKIQTLGALLGTLIAFIGSAYYFWMGNPTLGQGLIIMGLALPLMESLDLSSAFLAGKKMFRILSIASIASQFFTTLALIIAISVHVTVMPLLITYFLSWIVMKLYFFIYAFKHQKNSSLGSDTFSTGVNFSISNALGTAVNYLDRIALFHFMGARDVALYSFAIAPGEQLKALFKNTTTLILPKFSVREEAELQATMIHKMFVLGASSLGLALLYFLAAPIIIPILLPKYAEIVLHSQVYAFSLIGVMAIPLNSAINAVPKIKAVYLTNTINPIISVLLMLALIPSYGLWGAIGAKALSRVIGIFTTYAFFKLT